MNVNIYKSFALAMTLVLSACATTSQGPESLNLEKLLAEKHYLTGPAVDRIRNYQISGWNYVDPYHLILRSGVKDRYLITLRSYCADLSLANSIGFTTTVGALTTSDAVLLHGAGSIMDRCYIRYINRLEKTEDI